MRPWRVHGTHDVHLVVLERLIVFVHVDYVVRVVYPESVTIAKDEIRHDSSNDDNGMSTRAYVSRRVRRAYIRTTAR